ncbi:hypothetical protein ABBQ38_008554 [Trebouxia sp. C0009 RCD-2024]
MQGKTQIETYCLILRDTIHKIDARQPAAQHRASRLPFYILATSWHSPAVAAEWALPRRQIAGVDRTRHSSIVHTPGGYGERAAKWAASRHETDGEVRLARDKFGMRSLENTLQGQDAWQDNPASRLYRSKTKTSNRDIGQMHNDCQMDLSPKEQTVGRSTLASVCIHKSRPCVRWDSASHVAVVPKLGLQSGSKLVRCISVELQQ